MNASRDNREGGFLRWQLTLYPDNHADRKNLLIHALTVPLFWAGALALVAAPFRSGWLALAGLAAAGVAVALQGKGHRREETPPVPFRSPGDAVLRLVAEQLVTFPRFVLSGGFQRALSGPSPRA